MSKLLPDQSNTQLAEALNKGLMQLPRDNPWFSLLNEIHKRLSGNVDRLPADVKESDNIAKYIETMLEVQAINYTVGREVLSRTAAQLRAGDIQKPNAYLALALQELGSSITDLGTVMTQGLREDNGHKFAGIAIGFDRAATAIRKAGGIPVPTVPVSGEIVGTHSDQI